MNIQDPPVQYPNRPHPNPSPAGVLGAMLILFSAVPSSSSAMTEATGDPTGVSPLTVPLTTDPVRIDGVLDEPMWQHALTMELGFEVRPGENIEAPVATQVLVTYDADRLLVGFRCLDPQPSKIRARYRDRDNAWDDDFVGVVLDTFNDERRAYELIVNPLGVQTDAINDEVGSNYDTAWDAIWQSAGRTTATGYEVEMAIPFRQLRFQATKDPQTWGFDAIRSYPRGDRHHIGLFARERGQNNYLSKTQKIRGFAAVNSGRNLELVPTLTANRVDERSPAGELVTGSEDTDFGLTGSWAMTPNWTLSGTYNPDFSQVEADVLQLDVNEQFTLFFPETRPFFLEGADTFSTSMNLVHTRTISDPSAALKITGKQGKHTVGLFSARDDVTNILIPGSEGSSSASFDQSATSTAARYRYDLGGNSTLGVLLTDRNGAGYSNEVGAADLRWRPTERDSLRVQAAFSKTRYSVDMTETFDLTDEQPSGEAVQLGYRHSRRSWELNVNYRDRDTRFRADLGFLTQVDLRAFDADSTRTWHGKEGDFYNSLSTAAWIFRTERQSGELLTEGYGVNVHGEFTAETQVRLFLIDETRRFAGSNFPLVNGGFSFRSRPTAWLGLSASGNFGEWIDFSGVRPADQTILRLNATISFGRRFDSRWAYTYSSLDVDEGRLFIARAPEMRLLYYFNRRLYLRLIAQYTQIDSNLELTSSSTLSQQEDLLTQLLLVYEVNPRTALFVGYGDTWDNDRQGQGQQQNPFGLGMPESLRRQSRAFFIKLGYSWQP